MSGIGGSVFVCLYFKSAAAVISSACVVSHVRLFATQQTVGSSVHGIFPGKNTGAGCHFLLQY